ncbi:MAG: hypothetical protein V3V02_09730 [Rhizobiaceae bacterium]
MHTETTDNLDTLIKEEKHRVALEFFQDAWNMAIQEGIEPSILAETALITALTQLHSYDGEPSVSKLLDGLPARFESGHFDAERSLQ